MRVSWDDSEKFFSEGIEKGVIYPQNSPGVAWSGLVSVEEGPDSTPSSIFIDGRKAKDHVVPAAFSGTITAFTYPEEFEPYIGVTAGISSQPKKEFGFCYRDNRAIHLVYNATAAPSSDQYRSLGGDVNPILFSWAVTTRPIDVPYSRATSRLVVSLDFADPSAVSDLEDLIYGNDVSDPLLPDPSVVLEIFESYTTLRITDNGDGTWTASGPGSVVHFLDPDTFEIDWPSAQFIDVDSYRVYSL